MSKPPTRWPIPTVLTLVIAGGVAVDVAQTALLYAHHRFFADSYQQESNQLETVWGQIRALNLVVCASPRITPDIRQTLGCDSAITFPSR